MKDLKQIFEQHTGRLIHKWEHYFEVYERYFAPYRGKAVNMLEIGISHGGSLQMWREYFGPQANIFAVDINPECKQFEEERTKVFIGSQEDPAFLQKLKQQLPDLDILLDDGGHTMSQQLVTFQHLFDRVKDGGTYMVEDTHTSYWYEFHGGYKKKGSFIEFAKDIVDQMHAWHIDDEKLAPVSELTKNISGVYFHDSIIVFDKKNREEPFHTMRGEPVIKGMADETLKKESLARKVKHKLFGKKGDSFTKHFKK